MKKIVQMSEIVINVLNTGHNKSVSLHTLVPSWQDSRYTHSTSMLERRETKLLFMPLAVLPFSTITQDFEPP
jgi:hypothetical protein